MHPLTVLFIVVAVIAVTAFVCFVERGQRKILVNYAKRQVGNRVYGGQSSHLPFKLNMSGVIPPIFASSLILFPATLLSWFGSAEGFVWLRDLAGTLSPGQPIYVMLYAGLIVFFCFFYTALQYNPKETADNLKKSGAFVPGIRPGDQTARYLERILTRLTLAGAIYVTLVCLMPEFLILQVERAVLLRRHLAADHRGGDDGLHGAGAGLRDDAPVREPAAQGQLQGRPAGALAGNRRNDDESHGFREENLPQVQDRAAQARGPGDLLGSAP